MLEKVPLSRSEMMSRIGPRDTVPELAIRQALHRLGYRFRLHRQDLPGKPDIVLPKHRAAIFVHGCFWHGHTGCNAFRWPKTNEEFWREKIVRNMVRDAEATSRLNAMGWRVLTVWECVTKPKEVENTVYKIALWLHGQEIAAEIPV